jgi:hypothetical protein
MNDVMVFALAALIELPGVTQRVRSSYRCTRTTWAMRSRVRALPATDEFCRSCNSGPTVLRKHDAIFVEDICLFIQWGLAAAEFKNTSLRMLPVVSACP